VQDALHGRGVWCDGPTGRELVRQPTGRWQANPGLRMRVTSHISRAEQVRRAAEQISERYPCIDVLVNNAGAHIQERRLTGEGLEMNLAVNHLASNWLTRLLLPGLQAAAAGRVVNVSSEALRRAASFDDLGAERDFRSFAVYGRAKLAMLLCTYALDRRLVGSRVTVNALHPGLTATGIVDDVAPRSLAASVGFIKLFPLTRGGSENNTPSCDLTGVGRDQRAVLSRRQAGHVWRAHVQPRVSGGDLVCQQ
jgi:NAD(P)-dependent dehydrogenase (short-subunit alcohol dehydrogenase family)